MAAKIDIKLELDAVDRKNYNFYENLSDEEKKVFSPYILMRFVSNVQGSQDVQEWFIETTNELVNKNHWDLSKNHKALLWKLYAATGIGTKYYHPYLALNLKKDKGSKIGNLLADLYPNMKLAEVEMLADMMDKEDIKELLDNFGFDKKQRKEYE